MFGTFLDKHPLEEMIARMPACPFPLQENRAAWEAIAEKDKEDLLSLYAYWRGRPYPMCTATQFMAYVCDGSRKAYENPYFDRRRKLIASMLHCCVTGGEEALPDVIDGIWCICEESSWVVSAHNVNPIPDAPQAKDKPLPDADDPYIDLFAAQTAMILSLIGSMLGDVLDRKAPILRKRIGREIERRVLTPFMMRDDFWWMGFIRKDLCNWTPWILSNILLTASLELHDPLRFAGLADRACRMLDRWLEVVPQDGGCDEGTAYYNMAGGALLDCMELLERATQGRMAFWKEEKIRNILSFPVRTQLGGGWFVNFADCDAKPFLCGERLQRAGERLHDAALIRLGILHRGAPSEQIADTPHLSRLLMRLFHPAANPGEVAPAPRDAWLPDLQLRVLERGEMILCAKGGHNGESHNHNDVGSFMLYADGEPQIVDMGNMVYTSKTFSDARYTLMNTRSAYHNLPIIGGHEQRAGECFRAADVLRLEDGLRLDIAAAYGCEAGVKSCIREMTLGARGMTLRDRISLETAQPVSWAFILRERPEAKPGAVCTGRIRILLDGDLALRIEEIPVTDPRMAKNYPGSLWRLELTAAPERMHDRTFTMERMSRYE